MIRTSFFLTIAPLILGGLLWVGLPYSAQGQVPTDVLRYSSRLPAGGGPVMGRAGAGLSSGIAAPEALFGNPAGLGWLSSSVLSGDFAVNRTRSDARFTTPDASTSADRAVNDYRLGSVAGAYSFPTTQGALAIGVSFHQSNTYERGFDVVAPNRTNSITRTFLPARGAYEFDGESLLFDNPRSRIAYEAGVIDFSRSDFENGAYPFFQSASPQAPATSGQMTLEQQENILESGQMNELSFGAAVAVSPSVMLGGSFNYTFGSYTFERFYRETDVSAVNKDQVCASGLCPPADPADPQPPYDPYFVSNLDGEILREGFREMQLEERIDTDLSGRSFRLGLSAEPTDALRVGVHVKSPTWLNVDEVFGTEMRTFFDCDFSSGSCVRPDEGFSSGDLTRNDDFSYDLRTPWRFSGGLQYSLEGLTVAGGATLVDWTQAEVNPEDGSASDPNCGAQGLGAFEELNCQIQRLEATVNTRAGLEYEGETFSVRTGVAYQPSVAYQSVPPGEPFRDIENGETVSNGQLFLSAGVSFALGENATLHVNWLQERFDDQFVSYSGPGGSPTVEETVRRNRVLVGLTYRP